MHDFIVIGSGPSGTLAAKKILESNKSVLMIDIGDISSEKAFEIKSFAIKNSEARLSEKILSKFSSELSGKPGAKNYFGDQNLSWWEKYWDINFENSAKIGPSTTKGGYSLNWGAACMPPELLKMISGANNADYLTAEVLNFLGAKLHNEIQTLPPYPGLKHLSSAELFRQRYISRTEFLKLNNHQRSWRLSPAYIATNQTNISRCNGCGTCLIGCYADIPFNSKEILDELLKNYPSFNYLNQKKCVHVSESETDTVATCIDSTNKLNGLLQFKAKKIILAAGPLSSTTIIANSLNVTSKIKFTTSQLLSFGLISLIPGDLQINLDRKKLGLSEFYLYDDTNRPNVFLQFYSANQILRNYVGPSWLSHGAANFPIKYIDKFLIACQGYLDSSLSPNLYMELNHTNGRININGTKFNNQEIQETLISNLKIPGYITTPIKISPPGSGYHFGGSFPLGEINNKYFSDEFGRPAGLKNIHLVDASILPFIPAGPFTSFLLTTTLNVINKILTV